MSALDADVAEAADESDPEIEHTADGDRYVVRRFQDGDEGAFLDLFETVESLELGGGEEWFEWKYENQPAMDHVPIFVALHDGEMVGARPFISFSLRADPRTLVGLQTTDTMVHPDHRGRGVFSRMNDLAFAYYRQHDPDLMFSIPNDRSRPAYLDMGARVVEPVTTHLRIEEPSAFAGEKLGELPGGTERLLDGVATGFHSLLDSRREGSDGVNVEHRKSVPAETFAALASDPVPDEIHATRDERFYEWRFENPGWDYDAFIARRDGEPLAGLVAGTNEVNGHRLTEVSDVVPLAGETRLPGVAAALGRLLTTRPETDVFAVSGSAVPTALLRKFGFLPDDRLPLAPLASPTVLITMPLDGDTDDDRSWVVEGRGLADPASWQFPFAEHNTG